MATEEKPALTVLVGAGASIPLGLPSTPAVTEYVTRGRSGDTPTGKLAGLEDDARDFLQNMHAVLIDRCARHSFGAPKKPNFEDLLHAAETVANLRETFLQRSAGSMAALLTGGPAGDLISFFHDRRSSFAAQYLVQDLQELFAAELTIPEWYANLWRQLSGRCALTVATTNYDLAIEMAVPCVDQGFRKWADGKPATFARSSEWHEPTLMHLHGSVRFGYFFDDEKRTLFDREFGEIFLYDDPAVAASTRGAGSPQLMQSGERRIVGCLITGLNKPDKVLAMDPYQTYYRELSRSLETSPRLLIAGYGFGDYHLNSLVRRFTRWHGDQRRVAVIDFVSQPRWHELVHDPELFVEGGEAIMKLSRTVTLFDRKPYADPWSSPDTRCRFYPSGIEACATRVEEITRFLAS